MLKPKHTLKFRLCFFCFIFRKYPVSYVCPWKSGLRSFWVLKSPFSLRVVKHMQLMLVLDMYLPDFKHPVCKVYSSSYRNLVAELVLETYGFPVSCLITIKTKSTAALIYLQNVYQGLIPYLSRGR